MEIESAHSSGIDTAVRKACLAYLADNDVVPIDKQNVENFITFLTTKISAHLKENKRLSEQWDKKEDECDGSEEDFGYDDNDQDYWEQESNCYESFYEQYEDDYDQHEQYDDQSEGDYRDDEDFTEHYWDDYETSEVDDYYEQESECYAEDYDEQFADGCEQWEDEDEQYEDDLYHDEDFLGQCEDDNEQCAGDYEQYEDDYEQYEDDYEQYEDDYEQYEDDYEQYEDDYEQYEDDYEQYEDDYEQYEDDYEQYQDDDEYWEKDCMQYVEEYEYRHEDDEQYEDYYQSQDDYEKCDDYYGHYEDERDNYDDDCDNWEDYYDHYEDDNEHDEDYYYEQWCGDDNDDGYSSHEHEEDPFDDVDDYDYGTHFDEYDAYNEYDYSEDVECGTARTIQKSTTSTQTVTTRTASADAETQTLESTEIGERDKVEVLTINDGDVGYDYGRIFARCCGDSVNSLVVEDPYAVREDYQMNNWAVFCWTIGQRCSNLKLIDLCSAHWHDGLKDLMFLLKERHDIKLSFTAFKAKENHPRMFKFDSGWRVIADVGLDIYSGGFRRYESGYSNYKDRTCRKTYFTYCPPGLEAPVLPIDADVETCQSTGVSNSVALFRTANATKRNLQCLHWDDPDHLKDVCNYYHPSSTCSKYPNCPRTAWRCTEAHPWCSAVLKGVYCQCRETRRDLQLNHRY